MSGHLDEAALFAKPSADIGRMRSKAMMLGVIGIIGTAAGYFLEPATFWSSYLIGYMFWLLLSVGSMAMLMLQYLTGGAWAMVGRRIFEASAKNLPLLALLFIPIALQLPVLYPWARPEALTDPAIQTKAAYLNKSFFLVRAIGYFVIWSAFTFRFTSWGAAQDAAPLRVTGPEDRKFRVLAGPGLVVFVLTITFMSVDFVMSLDPKWTSTIFGVIFLGGAGLSTLAFTVVILAGLSRFKPMSDVMKTDTFHDYGKLMFAFIMLWAYFNISQLIIVWSGNLPEEIPFYLKRFQGAGAPVSVAILFAHFVLPFSILLSSTIKRNAASVARVGLFILAARALDVIWMVGPMARPDGAVHWVDFAAVLGLGAPWLFFFFRTLASRPLLPAHDPYFKEALDGGH